MSESPQRPYVPHRTPTRGKPAISSSDFMLSRPFVPDASQMGRGVIEPAGQTAAPLSEQSVPSIESFLAAPTLKVSAPPADVLDEDLSEEPDELPPLEHFLDPLPPISDFSANEPAADKSDWVETDWQRYDWQSVAALGDTERAQDEASNAWASTDWEVPSPRRTDRAPNPADAIATALDRIAQSIRNGDLGLPGGGSVADPATIAATLAALLGVRR